MELRTLSFQKPGQAVKPCPDFFLHTISPATGIKKDERRPHAAPKDAKQLQETGERNGSTPPGTLYRRNPRDHFQPWRRTLPTASAEARPRLTRGKDSETPWTTATLRLHGWQ